MGLLWLAAGLVTGLVALFLLGQSRWGTIRISEWPGFVCCLLAGRDRRVQANVILLRRRKQLEAESAAGGPLLAELQRRRDALMDRAAELAPRPSVRAFTSDPPCDGYRAMVEDRASCARCGEAWSWHNHL